MNDGNDGVLRAFSAEHVTKLTGLSPERLRYWDKTGFFLPEYLSEDGYGPHNRIYSFTDLIGLRVLSVLRRDHRVSMPHLREVARKLSQYSDRPWSTLKLFVLKRRVYFKESETEQPRDVLGKQYAIVEVVDLVEGLRTEAEKLRQRQPEQMGHVVQHRNVAHNAWVIAGTRIPVRLIRQFAADGYSVADILREYPILTEQDVRAALERSEKLTA